jgi:luciferase family oxidoreductase group 1
MGTPLPVSILDFSLRREGETTHDALRRTIQLAQDAETLGYHRFWYTEHHNIPRLANAAPPVLLAHIANVTRSIRIGSGGVMLPNHSPLVIAEQFGTLAALYPDRIDLGIGRATGTPGDDAEVYRMLRKPPDARAQFDTDFDELLALFRDAQSEHNVHVPSRDVDVPVWLLGSSCGSATTAGRLGLPFSYANHIAPNDLLAAMAAYRENFRPSPSLQQPYAMVSAFVIAADTDAEAQDLMTEVRPILIQRFRKTTFSPSEAAAALEADTGRELPFTIVGAPETVRSGISDLIRKTQAAELIVITIIRDPAAAYRSYKIIAQVCSDITRDERVAATG